MNLRYRIDENGEKVLQQKSVNQHNDSWVDVPTEEQKEEKRTPKAGDVLEWEGLFYLVVEDGLTMISLNNYLAQGAYSSGKYLGTFNEVFVKRDETLVRLPSVQSLRKNCISGAIQMWENNNTLGEITTYIYDYLKGEK